ncbi:uncharacterized protein LOC135593581 [Musa acuminata AAA Group]|uniref:uncharacterized protein LOC135593581 n=1 Tax=Musa acuminata AAA Group TaxID=214697 RepID=UPI0031D76850
MGRGGDCTTLFFMIHLRNTRKKLQMSLMAGTRKELYSFKQPVGMFLERTHLNHVRRSNIAWTWRSYSRRCSKWYRILVHHLSLAPLPMEDVCQLGSGFWMAWSRRHRHGVVWNCEVGGGSTFSFVAVSEYHELAFQNESAATSPVLYLLRNPLWTNPIKPST